MVDDILFKLITEQFNRNIIKILVGFNIKNLLSELHFTPELEFVTEISVILKAGQRYIFSTQ